MLNYKNNRNNTFLYCYQ